MPDQALALVRLLHLADSALPVGGAAHSFGLETLVQDALLSPGNLEPFLLGWIDECGVLDAAFCAAAHELATAFTPEWQLLNDALSARKPARESREGSLAMGRRLLLLANAMAAAGLTPNGEAHYATAFGLAASAFGIARSAAVAGWLHQAVASLISACQRLLPVGQSEAARILWTLKPAILAAAEQACRTGVDESSSFAPLVELAGMRHPRLATRLFIS